MTAAGNAAGALDIAARVLGITVESVLSSEPIKHGLTNESCLVFFDSCVGRFKAK